MKDSGLSLLARALAGWRVSVAAIRVRPHRTVAKHEEVMHYIEERRLMGKGIGYIDVHLLV